jgi:hypothetical protein
MHLALRSEELDGPEELDSRGQCAQRAIMETKQRDQKFIISSTSVLLKAR